jgi:hypothetical protein
MRKQFNLFGIFLALAIIFMIAGCGEEQKEPVGPINQTTVTTQEDVEPLVTTCADNDPSDRGIVPTLEDFPGGEPVCEGGVRVTPGDGPETIVYNLDGITGNDVTIKITVGDCGEVMSWSVPENIVIDKVYAKGGQGNKQNVYTYTTRYPSDGNLHCPVNPSGEYAGFSHIDFCFHYKLSVSKTADTEFTRAYDWTIAKEGDQTDLTLSTGQTYTVNYDVTVGATPEDSDWKVTGTITIFNNTPLDAVITSISDVADGVTATVDCALPYTLAAGLTLNCNYSAELAGAIDGTNTVTIVTSTPKVEGGTASENYAFGDPTTEIDECIDVTDDKYGALGTVCYADLPKTFGYTLDIGPYDACGEYTFTNIASYITTDDDNDTDESGSADWTVVVTVPCVGGCTLTQGYWKTHSKYGPAPYDATWGGMEDDLFFLSGQTYYKVLWTPPAGNVYYILAHQYIAAKLNQMNGADFSAVESEFEAATQLFEDNTPGDVAGLKGKDKKTWTGLASILDSYNNGYIGPGHCDE